MKLFFSVGEPSGDVHAANLIRELRARRPGIQCLGYGGPHMQEAGARLHYPLTELAVMWILRVALNLHRFAQLLSEADRFFAREKPDAVVLVDYPGFNWWMARRAYARGIPVFYYLPPQLWAWGPWRIRKVRRFVDSVLSGLPFEVEWYRRRGVEAQYVGHPSFDEIAAQRLDAGFVAAQAARPGRIVGLLPGSRSQELTANFPVMLRICAKLHAQFPDVRFLVAAFREEHRRRILAMLAQDRRGKGHGQSEVSVGGRSPRCAHPSRLPIEVCVGRTPEIIHLSHACLAVSGSVSLELLYRTTPAVILYQISRGAELVRRTVMTAPYITLVNLLADERLLPEHVCYRDESEQLASELADWLHDATAHRRVVARLEVLKRRVVQPGATARAAAHILARLDAERQGEGELRGTERPQGPHFRCYPVGAGETPGYAERASVSAAAKPVD